MKRVIHLFLTLFLLLFSQILLSQDIILRGKVRHANTYREISNVNIYIKNTKIGTSSDVKGAFLLKVQQPEENFVVIFEHISFYPLQMPLAKAQKQENFYLHQRVIQLPGVSVQAEKAPADIRKDLPQAHSIIEADNFEIRGYVDAGDLLRTEQSIQVEEKLSGKKTVTIRGGAPEDVIVLYNGIKMNNIYDNIFDLSLINLEDVKQLEIIRGSYASLYGAEAVSGVINIVPRTYKNYTIRFQQKMGSYASADWNLQLNRSFFKRLNLSYSYRHGSSSREYSSNLTSNYTLENKNSFHTASLVYDLSGGENDKKEENISLMYFRSNLDYKNSRFNNEELANFNQMISLCYVGDIGIFKNLNMISSYQWLDDEQSTSIQKSEIDRHFNNQSFNLNVEKRFIGEELEFLLAYQLEDSELDYQDQRDIPGEQSSGIESAMFTRQRHGLVSILKVHVPSNTKFYKSTDFDVSYRYDYIKNNYQDVVYRGSNQPASPSEEDNLDANNWRESTLKVSSHLSGNSKNFGLNVYLNFGKNYKFPTMFQQISSPDTANPNPNAIKSRLSPEEINNIELGIDLIKEMPGETKIDGWQISANLFKNSYVDRLRMFYLPGSPIAFYDNVQNAEISGLELKGDLFLLKNKITIEVGSSIYDISEKAAFPFRSDKKHIFNVLINHSGYSFQFHFYRESDQVGWVRNLDDTFSEKSLPGISNIDIHLSKTFEIKKFKIFANFSGRNLLNDDFKLEGIALRDRRFYVTFGVQY